ncbi:uncharacterized protein LOC117649901 [Thrips palmi]|uniref:Uncharacterized protein LOC117649901 n=1 Tax=Thrips palmi TaxID=161013 RepID=A0A6P8ZUK1_THRPL|nr:uncharacterized protein LOC117649901 [Thrips palmi]
MATECCSCGSVFSVNRQREVLNCGHQPCRPCLEANSRGSEKRCPTCSKKCCQTQNEGAVVTVQGHATVRLVRLAAADVAATHDAVSEELQHASNSLAALRSWAVAAAERQDLAALCAHAACAERVRGVLQEALALVHEEARRCLGQDHGDATSQRPCTDQERPQHASDQCVGAELKLEMECEEVDEMTKHQDAGGLKLSETLSMEGQPTVGADNVSNPETAIQEQPSSPEVKVEPCDTQDAVEQHSGNDVSDLPEVVQEAVVQRSAENSTLKAESSLLESLPAELLHAVLDYVPTEELPSLRLLSRRWSALVLDESLWRSRRLTVHADQDSAAVLRVAPALAELALEMSYPPLRGVEALRALAEGACQCLVERGYRTSKEVGPWVYFAWHGGLHKCLEMYEAKPPLMPLVLRDRVMKGFFPSYQSS